MHIENSPVDCGEEGPAMHHDMIVVTISVATVH